MPGAQFSSAYLQRLSDWFIAKICTDTAAVQRLVSGQYQTVQGEGAVPCALIDSPQPTTANIADETTGAVLRMVLMPRGTDVKNPDQLVINSIKYRVFDVKEPGTLEVFRRVQVVRSPQRGPVS